MIVEIQITNFREYEEQIMDERNTDNHTTEEVTEKITKEVLDEVAEKNMDEITEKITEDNNEAASDSVTETPDTAAPSYLAQPNKQKNRKMVTIIIAVIMLIVIIGGAFAYHSYNSYKKMQAEKYRQDQEALLKTEMSKLIALNTTSGTVNMVIQTEGDYAIVEKTIKEYFQELLTAEQHMESLKNDERFAILNSGDSEEFWNDKPEFAKATEAIATMKAETGADCDTITALLDEKNIEDRLDKEIGQQYKDLYKELMLSESTKTEFSSLQTEMDTTKTQLFTLLDKRQEMIDLLKNNQSQWQLEGTQVYFTDQGLLEQYNVLVNELNAL